MLHRAATLILCLICTAAPADVPRVVTDILPVQGLVARVMEGAGAPQLIVDRAASAHDYAMRPSKAAALEQADILIWIGPALTPWLARARDRLAPDALSLVLADLPGTTRLPTRDTTLFGGEAHEHGDGHDHDGIDPHVWLDPENAKVWLAVVAALLAAEDPANAATYEANAQAGMAEIDVVTREISDDLEALKGRPFLVYHDAFQYFERRFGLQAAGALSLSDASAPSPARIATLRAAVRDLGATCLLAEPGYNPKLVHAVFEGAVPPKIKIVDVMAVDVEKGQAFYPALLRATANAVAECLR